MDHIRTSGPKIKLIIPPLGRSQNMFLVKIQLGGKKTGQLTFVRVHTNVC